MALLKSSYIIPELNSYLLEKGIDKDTLHNFLDKHSYFELFDNQGIEYDTAESLLCIAYNLISRGYPTLASMKVGRTLLEYAFPDSNIVIETKEDRIKEISFNDFLPTDISKDEIDNYNKIFEGWNENGFSTVSATLGSKGYKLFSLFEDIRAVAYIQKALLFCLFANNKKDAVTIFIDHNHDYLSTLILDDLNELLLALSQLSGKKVPFLKNTFEHQKADVIIGTSWGKFGNYDQFKKAYLFVNAYPNDENGDDNKKRTADLSFLSAEKINYPDLGYSEETDGAISEFRFYQPERKDALIYLLNNLFRKKEFRPGQLAIINRALQNKDVIGLLPTGGGKSLCFQLCGLMQPGLNLVIDPINSLMKDQYAKLCEYYIGNSGFINSLNKSENEDDEEDGLSENEQILKRFANGEILFLFISPERLLIDKFRRGLVECIQGKNLIHYCVIDEAHCVSEWGHDFRIPYLRLADNLRRFCSSSDNLPVLFALTATASYDVLSDVQREMNLQADSIISLPPDSINRKELAYNIIDLSKDSISTNAYPAREYELSGPKYKILDQLFTEMPALVAKSSVKSLLLDNQLKDTFYKQEKGKYKNAGIIFCTTRSVKLPGGVVWMHKNLSGQYPFLKAATYFSPTDSETVLENIIDEKAYDSAANQEKFLNDELNLMICTKGFGMGIDKPNLRYTIHYSMPSSVESFYQESGRAGRDRKKAICNLLYHPADEQTALDFLEKSFRGVEKEMTILDEILTEVRYEPRFFLEKLEDFLRSELDYRFRLKFYPTTEPDLIYINGAYVKDREAEKNFGAIRLKDLSHLSKSVKNVPPDKVQLVVKMIQIFFRKEVPDGNFKKWVTRTKSDGIRTTLNKQSNNTNELFKIQLGFTNDIDEIVKLLNPVWEKITPRVIKAGYGFAQDPLMFIENLTYRYALHLENLREKDCREKKIQFFKRSSKEIINNLPRLTTDIISALKGFFYRLRLVNDTQRAIYRLIQVGIIDDYEMDYAGENAVIYFSKKDPATYLDSLRIYLRRYLGINSVETYVKKYENEGLDQFIKPLKIITDFFQNEVREKRIRGLKLMKELCELAILKGEEEFKQSIVLYFTSKYAKPEYLPADVEDGKIENFEAIFKYINYLSSPPDELGSEKDNARHLFGACNRLRIGIGSRNHTMNMLNVFAWLALADQRILSREQAKLSQLLKEFSNAVMHFASENGWLATVKLLQLFQNRLININPEIEQIVNDQITNIIELKLTNQLFQLNQKLKPAFYEAT